MLQNAERYATPRMLLSSTRISRAAQGRLGRLDEPLTPRQWRLLLRISEGYDRADALGKLMGLRPPTVSESIDTLRRRGLVRSFPATDDRRRSILELTPAGEKALAAAVESNETLIDELFEALPEELRSSAEEIFDRLAIAAARILRHEQDTKGPRS